MAHFEAAPPCFFRRRKSVACVNMTPSQKKDSQSLFQQCFVRSKPNPNPQTVEKKGEKNQKKERRGDAKKKEDKKGKMEQKNC